MKHTIALVDDDRNILTSISMTLEQEGYTVRTYTDGESALQAINAKPVDLAVLDIKMPRMDGMELLQRLRQRNQMPVIFLTSKDEEVDELMGLRLGADDYIKKPFSQRLLIERIRTLLRRNDTSRAEGSGAAPGGVLVRGDLTLDETKHQCNWKGQNIELTVTEFLLVKALALRPGMVKTRDQLIDGAYGENIYVDDRTIDSHIKRVRKKFRQVDDTFNQFETLYGIGIGTRKTKKTKVFASFFKKKFLFLYEKKNQKTFAYWLRAGGTVLFYVERLRIASIMPEKSSLPPSFANAA